MWRKQGRKKRKNKEETEGNRRGECSEKEKGKN